MVSSALSTLLNVYGSVDASVTAIQEAIERSNFHIQAFGELRRNPPVVSNNEDFTQNSIGNNILGPGAQQILTGSSAEPRPTSPNSHVNEESDDSAYTSVGEISSDSIGSSDEDVEEILRRTYGPPPDSEISSSDDNAEGNSEYPWSGSEHA